MLQRCVLHSRDGSRAVDISGSIIEVNIYENILVPGIFADINILDENRIIESFPVIGEELITLETDEMTFEFAVDSIKDVQANSHGIYNTVLKVCSEEIFQNAAGSITLREKGRISDTVQTILNSYIKTKKSVTVDTTDGVANYLLKDLNPFKAIDYLKRKAISNEYDSSSFCFFENSRDGFCFTTFEKLYSQEIQDSNKVFFQDDIEGMQDNIVFSQNIISIVKVSKGNTLSKIRAGAFRHGDIVYDVLTGETKEVSGDNSNGLTNTSDFMNEYKDNDGKSSFNIMSDKEIVEYDLRKRDLNYAKFMTMITEDVRRIEIYGRDDLVIGDVIEIRSPEKDMTGKKFLVTKSRRMLTPSRDRMILEVISGGI